MVLHDPQSDEEGKQDEAAVATAKKDDRTNMKGARNKEKQTDEQEENATKKNGKEREKSAKTVGKETMGPTPLARTTVAQLRERLQQLKLPTYGRKAELEYRLKKYKDGGLTDGETSRDEEDEDHSEEDNSEAEKTSDPDILNESDTEEKDHTRADTPRNEEMQRRTRTRRSRADSNFFTIKDIEGSISHFSGDDKVQVEKWVEEFEDMSTLLEWSELQKVIYAKRLLSGSAKQYIALQRGITTWKIMKRRLVREFESKLNSAELHSQLMRRKRLLNETPRQYIYAMGTIANQGVVEEEALIQYIIDGTPGDENSKTILYSSSTITELRKNLERYDKMKEKSEKRTSKEQKRIKGKEVDKNEKGNKQKSGKESRCFGCGSAEHVARECPDKEKGPKCFKCNEFGHIASKCGTSDKPVAKKDSKVNVVQMIEQSATDDELIVEINGKRIQSMVDTGTYQTLLRHDEYKRIGSPPIQPSSRVFQGFGCALVSAVGVFQADMVICGEVYVTKIYVVLDTAMNHALLIGKELTRNMNVNIKAGRITIEKLTKNIEPQENAIPSEEAGYEKRNGCDLLSELPSVNCIEANVVGVASKYRGKIERLVKEHKPREEVETNVETKITLQDETPVCLKPRRLAVKEKAILDAQIDEWLHKDIIQPSKSNYSSPVVIVPKKNGEYRVCIDYRQLNKKIIRDRFPMPLIDDRIDALAKTQVFSVLDLRNGFFHVPVAAESRKYTSFVTPDAQFEFLKTPFGLCNSPTSFLRFIDEVFCDLQKRNVVLTYLDDLIIPGRDEEEALTNLEETLAVAAEKGLKVNWKKSAFLRKRVEYLGYVIEGGNVSPSPSKIHSVKNFPLPKTKKAIQSFLGLVGYFRRFIRDYARIARPLSDILKNNRKFQFGEAEERSFNQLKRLLTSEPILRIYRPDAITELHTDATQDCYGPALLQKHDNEDQFHVVHFMSRKTSDAERKLHSYELETLAVVQAVKKFRVYLLGIKFTLVTDCSALQKTLNKTDISPKVARWALMLEEYEYKVEHRAGTRLKHVDALSRYPVMAIADKLTPVIKKQQDEEERLRVIKKILEKEPYEDYVCENGILMKGIGDRRVIVLPATMYRDVISKAHENGHFGVKKMQENIKSEYYIPNLTEKLEKYVSCCVQCILAERKAGKKEGLLRLIPKGDVPLSTYHIDHLGPMTATSKLYKYLFVVVDGFSKFVWIYPTKTTGVKEVLDRLKSQQRIFGNPQQIISDRGSAFTSTDFRSYCSEEHIEHILITTSVPRGNGQVERINRVIIPVLTKLSFDCPDKWYRHVDKVQNAINSTHQRSVGTSPFKILFGVKMRQKEDTELLTLIEQESIALFDEEQEKLRITAKDNIARIQEENKKTYNRNCKPATQYHIGDLVAIKRCQFNPGSKLKSKYLGPYKISQVKGADRYEMIREGNGDGPKITTSSADQMKPYLYYSPGTGDHQEWPNVETGAESCVGGTGGAEEEGEKKEK